MSEEDDKKAVDEALKQAAATQRVDPAVRERVARIQAFADATINMFSPGDALQMALCIMATVQTMQPSDPLIGKLPPDMQRLVDAARAASMAAVEVLSRRVVPVVNGSGIILPFKR